MKIAIQLFGHMRTFQKCSLSLFSNLIQYYDCDLFIHTWSDLNYKVSEPLDSQQQEKFKEKILNEYQPKLLKIEKQSPFDHETLLSPDHMLKDQGFLSTPQDGITNMLYSMYTVNQLRKSHEHLYNIKYDYVIFIRPDIMLHEQFNISLYEQEFLFNPNTVVAFLDRLLLILHNDRFDAIPLTSDLFLLTKPDIASRLFKSLPKPESYYSNFFHKTGFCAEKIFQEYVKQQGIALRYYQIPLTILRLNGDATNIGNKFPKNFYTMIAGDEDYADLKRKVIKYRKLLRLSGIILLITFVTFIVLSL